MILVSIERGHASYRDKSKGVYVKDVSHLQSIDIYAILQIYGVTDHAIGHAIKKLLCAGKRGAKSKEQDVIEAKKSLERYMKMQDEI